MTTLPASLDLTIQKTETHLSKLPFPWKLYEMLEDVENSGDDNIVSWVQSGKAFQIHELKPFLERIIPHYFNTTKLKSFQRQLGLYGFTRISEGKYCHPQFIKGSKTLCLSINTKNPKSKRIYTAMSKDIHDNKTHDSSNTNSTEWRIQLHNILEKGADYELRRFYEEQKRGFVFPKPTTRYDNHQDCEIKKETVIEEESSSLIFGDMKFHTLS